MDPNQPNPDADLPLLAPDASPMAELEARCAAYSRKDRYGTLGLGKVSFKEKILLRLALVTLVPVRVLMGVALVLAYYVVCRVCTLFCEPEGEGGFGNVVGWRRVAVVKSGRVLSRAMLFVMGFYWITETVRETTCTDHPEDSRTRGVIISNHVSYLDILYHMTSSFPSFVTKRSVANLPLVGLISKCLGCVYVQRESKSSDSKGVSGVVTERIQKVHHNKLSSHLMLFPEGTTTNGEFLLPFKTGAFLGKVPVLPVLLKYPYKRFNPAWDSISGVRHLVLPLCQFVNHLEVMHLPIYFPSEKEKEDPKLYANNVRKMMAAEGNLVLTDIGLADKRIYHTALKGNDLPHVLHQKDE